MPHNAFHFAKNKYPKKKDKKGHDVVFKLSHFMKKIMKGLRKAWTAGEKITIGRAVCFVQYMPRKPIKHDIKVFAVCCAHTALLLGFEVYVGTEQVETRQ